MADQGSSDPHSASSSSSSSRNNNDSTTTENSDCFLLVENPSKSNNWGPLLRCAAAFGVRQVVLVGYRQCSTEGSHGAARHVSMVAFPTWDQAVTFLRTDCHVTCLVGVLGGVAATTSQNLHQDLPVVVVRSRQNNRRTGESFPVALADASGGTAHDASSKRGHHDDNHYDNDNKPQQRQQALFPLRKHEKDCKDGTTITEKYDQDEEQTPAPLAPHLGISTCVTEASKLRSNSGNLCLVVSKCSPGLELHQARCCEAFVHIPMESSCLLDTAAELSIVLHHLCKAPKHGRVVGQKFEVATFCKGEITKEQRQLEQAQRSYQRQARTVQQEETLNSMADMFGQAEDDEQG